MRYAVRIRFKVTSSGRWNHSFVRAEYALNNLESATLFDSIEEAERAAEICLENMRSRCKQISASVIPIEEGE